MSNKKNQLDFRELRRQLTSGEMGLYRKNYEAFRDAWFNFAARYTNDRDLIADSYHDAFIALHENVVEGKITELRSGLKTYIFSIAKYTLFAKLKKQGREISSEIVPIEETVMEGLSEMEFERHRALKTAMHTLTGSCREILVLFYYRRFSIEAIMHHMDYKNENTVKAHKSRCLKRLREEIANITKASANADKNI